MGQLDSNVQSPTATAAGWPVTIASSVSRITWM
jgi:hypothetical protein